MSLYKGDVLISGSSRIKAVQCTLAEYTIWANNDMLQDDTYYEIYDDITPVVIKSVDCTFGEYLTWCAEGSIDEDTYYNIIDDNAGVGSENIIDSVTTEGTTWSSAKIKDEIDNAVTRAKSTWGQIE